MEHLPFDVFCFHPFPAIVRFILEGDALIITPLRKESVQFADGWVTGFAWWLACSRATYATSLPSKSSTTQPAEHDILIGWLEVRLLILNYLGLLSKLTLPTSDIPTGKESKRLHYLKMSKITGFDCAHLQQ